MAMASLMLLMIFVNFYMTVNASQMSKICQTSSFAGAHALCLTLTSERSGADKGDGLKVPVSNSVLDDAVALYKARTRRGSGYIRFGRAADHIRFGRSTNHILKQSSPDNKMQGIFDGQYKISQGIKQKKYMRFGRKNDNIDEIPKSYEKRFLRFGRNNYSKSSPKDFDLKSTNNGEAYTLDENPSEEKRFMRFGRKG